MLIVIRSLDALNIDCLLEVMHLLDVYGLKWLVLNCNATLIGILIPVHPQNNQRVRHAIERMLHYELLVVWQGLLDLATSLRQHHHTSQRFSVSWLQFEHFLISDIGFVGLIAFLIQNAKIVPNFTEVRFQGRRFYDRLERLSEFVLEEQ